MKFSFFFICDEFDIYSRIFLKQYILFKNLGICHDPDITDFESLPEAIPRDISKDITLIEEAAASFVTIDLETTDLSNIYSCN